MAHPTYVRTLRRAYLLEVLGETVYREGSSSVQDGSVAELWETFAETEAQMQHLLAQELQRISANGAPSRAAIGAARGLGRVGRFLGSTLLGKIIRRVLDRRRYSRWAVEFGSHNPHLWRVLVAHELKQAAHFERRQA